MILDNQSLFSDAQAITATAASTNAYDFGPVDAGVKFDMGKGEPVALLVQVVESFNNLTSLKIDIELDATTTFTPDKTITLGTYTLAELVKGFQIVWSKLPKGMTMRYAQLKYTVTGTAPTTGKITAGVVAGVQTNGV